MNSTSGKILDSSGKTVNPSKPDPIEPSSPQDMPPGQEVNWEDQHIPDAPPPGAVPTSIIPSHLIPMDNLIRRVADNESHVMGICMEKAITIIKNALAQNMYGSDLISEAGAQFGFAHQLALAAPIATKLYDSVESALSTEYLEDYKKAGEEGIEILKRPHEEKT